MLNRSIEKLQKNGVDDFLVVAECINQRNDSYLSADVFENRKQGLFCGKNVIRNLGEDSLNIDEIYVEAKQNMHSIGDGLLPILKFFRGNF